MSDRFGLSETLQAIVVRRTLILVVAFALFASVLAVTFMAPPNYVAAALVEVLQPQTDTIGPDRSATSDAAAMVATVNTEAATMGSESIARAAYAKVGEDYVASVRSSAAKLFWFLREVCALGQTVRELREVVGAASVCTPDPDRTDEKTFRGFFKSFAVEVVRGSRLIRVSASASDPALAAKMANTLSEGYIQERAEELSGRNTQLLTWLKSRVDERARELTSADQAVASYRKQTDLIEMGKEADAARRTPTTERLAGMLNELNAATASRAQAELRLKHIRELRISPESIASATEIMGSELIRSLRGREAAARQRAADLRATFGPKYPAVIAAEGEVNELQARLNAESMRILDSATHDYEQASVLVTRLEREVAEQKARAGTEQLDRVKLRDLEREAVVKSELQASLLRRINEAADKASWQEPMIRLASRAFSPEKPVFPDKRLMVPLGLIGSISAACLLGIVLEARRKQCAFVDPIELEQTTGTRVIGAVPRMRRFVATQDQKNDFALSIENIAMRICGDVAANSQSGGRIIAVTSAIKGEGKSAIALALARWLAAGNEHVLLIDGDLRRPAVLKMVGPTLRPSEGSRPHQISSLPLRLEEATGLELLTLGEVPLDPVQVVLHLGLLLAVLRRSYSFIVVDTPPLLAVADALAVVPSSDAILFAVQWGASRQRAVRFALDRLQQSDRERVDLLLTKVDQRTYRRYRVPGSEQYGHGGARYLTFRRGRRTIQREAASSR